MPFKQCKEEFMGTVLYDVTDFRVHSWNVNDEVMQIIP